MISKRGEDFDLSLYPRLTFVNAFSTKQNEVCPQSSDCLYQNTGLLPDTKNCWFRMRLECRERFPATD